MKEILKCLDLRQETLRLVRRFCLTDISTITEKSVRLFATLERKVSYFRSLQDLDSDLASKHETWSEKSGLT